MFSRRNLVTAFAASVAIAAASTPAQAEFRCGPHAYAYEVSDTAGNPGPGVRCVRFVDRGSFVWYGEGRWPAAGGGRMIYRHLGWAKEDFITNVNPQVVFKGFAADFAGNGETVSGSFPGNISLTASDGTSWTADRPPSRFQVRGAWAENWQLRGETVASVEPLGAVGRCGSFMRTFGVNTPLPDDPENDRLRQTTNDPGTYGIRCLLDADGKFPAAWFGEGAWGGNRYRHIGTAGFWVLGPAWGASDICSRGIGFCGRTNFGDLRLRFVGGDRAARSVRVTGAWDEWWDR
jgi:hypothetical protein